MRAGSIYKLIGLDIIIWLLFFYTFSGIYRCILNKTQKDVFEKMVVLCREFTSIIQTTFVFVLGFYVTTVLNRWWGLWNSLPWPDDVIHYLTTYLNGQVQNDLVLSLTGPHFVRSRLLEEGERRMMEVMAGDSLRSMFWIPHMWATRIALQARMENRIESDLGLRGIVDAVNGIRRTCALCQHVEFIQETASVKNAVVTLATYSYYCALALGSQSIVGDYSEKDDINTYFPITSVFLLVLYVGWLKVAESLIDPYGEDDADFELNWLLDRHIKVTYMTGEGVNTDFKEFTWKDMFPWLYDQALTPNPKMLVYANMMDKDKDVKMPDPVVTPIPPGVPAVLEKATLFRLLRRNNVQVAPAPAAPTNLQNRYSFKLAHEDHLFFEEEL
ncbi:unnamed protein product, partial [Darwinula stevensoni]